MDTSAKDSKSKDKPSKDKSPKDKSKAKDTASGGSDGDEVVLKTSPYDPRFPNQNQTRNCYQNYLDYHRCLKVKDNDEKYCHWYQWVYTELCPKAWTDKWDTQRENGIFAGRI